MSDLDLALSELKREIVESRNQAIKTDNQVKNLGLDVKGFERRFDSLEKRTRVAGLGMQLFVAGVIAMAAYVVSSAKVSAVADDIERLQSEANAAKEEAAERRKELDVRLADINAHEKSRAKAEEVVLRILTHLKAKRDADAMELLPEIRQEDLSELEAQLITDPLRELRARGAEVALKAGSSHLRAKRLDQAAAEFEKCVRLEPEGPLAVKAMYYQITALVPLERWAEVEPLARKLAKERDVRLRDEMQFLLGKSLAHQGKSDEAKRVLRHSAAGGAYQASARSILKAIEGGLPLPGLREPSSAAVAPPEEAEASAAAAAEPGQPN